MLMDLKDKLKKLAADRRDPFARLLRARVGAKEARRRERPLRNMVLMMPELLGQLRVWMTEPEMRADLRGVHGFILSYLYHPEDILPEKGQGLFGFLDDAFLVALAFQRALAERRARGLDCALDSDADLQVAGWLEHARAVIPLETAQVQGMLDDLLDGRTLRFHEALGAEA